MSTTATPAETTLRVNKWLEGSRFNAFHFTMVGLCLALMTMDGYDLFVYGAAMPLLMKSFGMSAAQAGAVGSAAVVGTVAGALILGPLADKVGRRNMIVLTVVLCTSSMLFAGLSHNVVAFGLWRFMFGVGNGAMVPNIMALVSEWVPKRNRSMSIASISSGVQAGGMFGALMGMWAFPHFGWRGVFLFAAIPMVLAPFCSRLLPEATTHLAKVNRFDLIRKFMSKSRPDARIEEDAVLEVDEGRDTVPLKAVFEEQRAFSTVLLWVVYAVNLYTIYGFTIWLPRLMVSHGFSLTSGLKFMLGLSISSIVGSFIAGRIADRVGPRYLISFLCMMAFCSITLVGFATNYTLLMVLVSLAGVGFNGAQNVLNGYIPAYYPPSMRSTAMAYNFAFGRLGSIIGPTAIGVLVSMHFTYETTLIALALPSLLSAAGILVVQIKHGYTYKLARLDEAGSML